jgi:hypothetical protein
LQFDERACNPNEIRKLRAAGYTVKTSDRLHAKVFWTSQAVYVGSANASANGLGFEGTEVEANIEAGIIFSEPTLVTKIEKWLNRLTGAARPISETDLKTADLIWRARRKSRDRLTAFKKGPSLLRQSKNFFREKNVFLWVYNELYTSETKAKVEQKQKAFGPEIDAYEVLGKNPPSAGDVIVDVYVGGRSPECLGLFRITDDISPMKSGKYTVLFCRKINDVDRVKMSRADKKAIEKYVRSRYLTKAPKDRQRVIDDRELFENVAAALSAAVAD